MISMVLPIFLTLTPTNAQAQTRQTNQNFVYPNQTIPKPAVTDPAAQSETPGIAIDPNLDRSFLLPTAMTQPKSTLTYSNYELLFHGITYGITDHLQGSLTLLPPYVKDMPLIGSLALKGQIMSLEWLKIALQGSFSFTSESSSSDTNSSSSLFGLGAFASACLVDDCSSLTSFSTTLLVPDFNQSMLLAYSGSLTQRISSHAKLLVEIASASFKDDHRDFENAPGLLINYGIRFHGKSYAADVGFMRPVGDSFYNDEFVLGLPFLNFSYRVS
jgi:hypothetical protein